MCVLPLNWNLICDHKVAFSLLGLFFHFFDLLVNVVKAIESQRGIIFGLLAHYFNGQSLLIKRRCVVWVEAEAAPSNLSRSSLEDPRVGSLFILTADHVRCKLVRVFVVALSANHL